MLTGQHNPPNAMADRQRIPALLGRLINGMHRREAELKLFENSKTGGPLNDIKTARRAALSDAGIPHIPFHCAGRHTFGTRAAESEANLKDIQEIMDHSDINTTMGYVHATDPGKRRTVEAAARVSKVENIASHMPHKKTATG